VTPLKVKPRNQRNQEDVEPSSRRLKRIRGGVCAAFRRSERGVEVVSKYGDLVHSTEFLDFFFFFFDLHLL
jgi:hypothetical protein